MRPTRLPVVTVSPTLSGALCDMCKRQEVASALRATDIGVGPLSQRDPKAQALRTAVLCGLPEFLKELASVSRYYAPGSNVGDIGRQLDVLQSFICSHFQQRRKRLGRISPSTFP